MSFYTALTGLSSATAQLSTSANNIANVGTTGFKRGNVQFGDIFSTSPLQRASSGIGQGVSLRETAQEFTQGNITTSGNSLDLAVAGDGFFNLKTPDGLQDIYTRNGAFSLSNDYQVVNSAGQRLQAAPVDSSGKADVRNLRALAVPPKTSGYSKETANIRLALNLPSDAPVIDIPFDRENPASYNRSTAMPVYDSGGNEYLATIYYVKTSIPSESQPLSKWQTYLFVGETEVRAGLKQAGNSKGAPLYVNKYGDLLPADDPQVSIPLGTTELFMLDELTDRRYSTPASAVGAPVSSVMYSNGFIQNLKPGEKLEFEIAVDGAKLPERIIYVNQGAGLVGTTVFASSTVVIDAISEDMPKMTATDRYIEYSGWGESGEKIRITQSATPSTASGVLSVVGEKVYQGTGTDSKLIGMLDKIKNGLNGQALRINLNAFENGDFEASTVRSSSIEGWVSVNNRVKLDGKDNLAGWPTPVDATKPLQSKGDGSDLNSTKPSPLFSTTTVATGDPGRGAVSVKLESRSLQLNRGAEFGIVRGPALYSDEALDLRAGAEVSFDWKAVGGGDAYDVYAYLLNTNTGRTIKLIDKTGLNAGESTGWSRVGNTVPEDGEYRFVFVSGSFDATGGLVLGASLNVDNIFVSPGAIDPAGLAALVTYENDTPFTASVDVNGIRVTSDLRSSPEEAAVSLAKKIEDMVDAGLITGVRATVDKNSVIIASTKDGENLFIDRPEISLVSKKIRSEVLALPKVAEYDPNEIATTLEAQINNQLGVLAEDPRYGIRVRFDKDGGRFSFESGTTGDSSSIRLTPHVRAQAKLSLKALAVDEGDAITVRVAGKDFTSTVSSGANASVVAEQLARQITLGSSEVTARTDSLGNLVLISRSVARSVSAEVMRNGTKFPAVVAEIPGNTSGNTLATTLLGLRDELDSLTVEPSPRIAVRGKPSSVARMLGGRVDATRDGNFSVNALNESFFVSVDGISGTIRVPPGSYSGEALSKVLEQKINGELLDPQTGRRVLGVKALFDSAQQRFVFETATSGDDASIQVIGSSDFGLAATKMQFGKTSQWIKPHQHIESERLQFVIDGIQTDQGVDVSDDITWWPIYLDRGELTFDLNGDQVQQSGPTPYEKAFLAGGRGALSLSIDFRGSRQVSSGFSILDQYQDGSPEGDMVGLTITEDGLVQAAYSNGLQMSLGKVVLANFERASGLRQRGDTAFMASASSGLARIGEPGVAGYGTIRAGALERANVDITQELIDLISAQRNFQASAQAIRTNSETTQSILQIRS